MNLSLLMARAAQVIERHPDTSFTKTALLKQVRGKTQHLLAAIDALLEQGYVGTTLQGKLDVYHSLKPFPFPGAGGGNGESTGESTRKLVGGGFPGNTGEIGTPGRNAFPRGTNDRQVPHRPLGLVTQPRCRVCRDPTICDRVNKSLVEGYSTSAILQSLTDLNSGLPSKHRVTIDSLQTHRAKHFDLQVGANAVWRHLQEQRMTERSADYDRGVASLVNPMIYLETMMIKGYASLVDQGTAVTPEQGAGAARELARLLAHGDDEQKWAEVHAKQNRIITAFRQLPPQFQQQVLDAVDLRTPPQPGDARLALVEATPATDDDFDSGDDDFDEDDDED